MILLALAVSAIVTPGQWDLYSGSSKVSSYATEAACVTGAKARNATRVYTCRTRTGVAVTVSVDPPPTCPPKPADETQAGSCPVGTTGTWTQTRSYVSAPYPTCWTAGAFNPATAPNGTCSAIPVDPPPPPPTGDVIFASPPSASVSLKGGQTLVLKSGTYTSLKVSPCASWCVVKAEVDGSVTLPNIDLGAGNWNVQFEGLKFKGSGGSSVTGSNVKFLRTAFEGGPSMGNDVSLQIGTNDHTPGASNILLEDSWVYGLGGRYKVLVYNSTGVVLRRVVARHDGGWAYDSRNPQGGFSLYDSANVICENCLFVDSVQNLNGFEAAIYLVSNGTTSTHQSNVSVAGSIVIGSPNNGLAAEGQSAATYSVTDLIVSGSKAGAVNTNGAGHTLNVIGLTANVAGAAIAKWSSAGSVRVTNCKIVKGSTQGATLTNCPGGAGAVVEKRIGADGSLFGEAGYLELQRDSLWPWPNEARIKADFDSVRPAFGGKSLTEYVKAAP